MSNVIWNPFEYDNKMKLFIIYLSLLQVWLKKESKNYQSVSIGIALYYTASVNVGLFYVSTESIRETTALLNSWVTFLRNLTGYYGPCQDGAV
jgi:ABC-type Mn2+/Zn2+ transport system permease subunit